MRPGQFIIVGSLLAGTALVSLAQNDTPNDQQLYLSGLIGYSNGNCVKASRYWYAYLLRRPAGLDAAHQAQLERVIAACDAAPTEIGRAHV